MKGDWKAECDVCGFVFESSKIVKRWDGMMVDEKCYEPRHIGDFYRYRSREEPLPFTRDRKIKYRCYATLSADVTPTTGAWTTLGLNTEIADQYAEFTTGTSTFRPTAAGTREFRFGVTITNVSGEATLKIALYKNGSAAKTSDQIITHGPGTRRLAVVWSDSTALSTDDYLVKYFITGSSATIEAHDSGTFLEVK